MNRNKKGEKCYPVQDLGCETCKLGSENTLVSFQIIEILYLFLFEKNTFTCDTLLNSWVENKAYQVTAHHKYT